MKAIRLKTHHFHSKLSHQKSILRQTEWWVWNGPVSKNEVLLVTTLFIWKFCFSLRASNKESWFDVPATQMPIFIVFVSARVLFDSVFFLWTMIKGKCHLYPWRVKCHARKELRWKEKIDHQTWSEEKGFLKIAVPKLVVLN